MRIQSLNDRPVGRQQRLAAELVGRDPLERLGLKSGRLASILVDREHLEFDHAIGVIMP